MPTSRRPAFVWRSKKSSRNIDRTGITEALMRAHAANGDRLAVQYVYQAHASALAQLDLDDVADSTSDLYEHLRSYGS